MTIKEYEERTRATKEYSNLQREIGSADGVNSIERQDIRSRHLG